MKAWLRRIGADFWSSERTCRFGHYNCLRDLRPQPVLDALQRLAGEPLADPLPLER